MSDWRGLGHRSPACYRQRDQPGCRPQSDGSCSQAAHRRFSATVRRAVWLGLGVAGGLLPLLALRLGVEVAHLVAVRLRWRRLRGASPLGNRRLQSDRARHRLHWLILDGCRRLLGTTISPYLFFWQAEEEVEEVKERQDAKPLERAPDQATPEFSRIRVDTYLGMGLSNLVALFIILTTAATLNAHGITDIQTASQAAEALHPIAGLFAFVVFRAWDYWDGHACAAGFGGIVGLRVRRDFRLARRASPQSQ